MKTVAADSHRHPDPFDHLAIDMHASFEAVAAAHGHLLFTTNADPAELFKAYIENLDESERQYHTCHCCRRFIEQFGTVVAIDKYGQTVPAMWDMKNVPHMYKNSIAAVRRLVAKAKVNGVFLSSDKTWGTPQAGGWSHFSVTPLTTQIYARRGLLTASQAMAAKREDFRTLSSALSEFDITCVSKAVTMLRAESLYRSEKVLGPAEFLLKVHEQRGRAANMGQRANFTWKAVADAPAGFCTPRSSMVGTLLEDIANGGMDFDTIKRRFDAKMNPLQYQRPQAPASAGNIRQAEKLVQELGLAPSLERRFARPDEVEALWRPVVEEPASAEGVFGHLTSKQQKAQVTKPVEMPAKFITFTKFRRTVLPHAKKMEAHTRFGTENFCGLLTAVHSDAPPILQWDHPERRNPVSWYVYNGGSHAAKWGLQPNRWVPVIGVTLQPSMWGEDETAFSHHGESAIFLLEGAKDQNVGSLCLFPECLKSELHGIRATVEAHSRSRQPVDDGGPAACGLRTGDKSTVVVRVTTSTGTATYEIDRWD